MNKVSFEKACDMAYNELLKQGIQAADVTAEYFDEFVSKYCAEHDLKIN